MAEGLAPAAGTPRTEPAGISGWLILPAIGTAIAPFWVLKDAIDLLAAIANPGFARSLPALQTLIISETMVNVVFAGAWSFSAFLLYKQKKLFPIAFIAVCAAQLITTYFDIIIANSILGARWASQDTKIVLKPLLYAAIWIPYMMLSHRVKNTFIN